jgi:hypothetical protein
MSELFSEPDIGVIARHVDEWLATYRQSHEVVVDAGRDPEAPRRWFIRMHGEEKEFTTIWLTLGQRTLRYETYVMPAPEVDGVALPTEIVVGFEVLPDIVTAWLASMEIAVVPAV